MFSAIGNIMEQMRTTISGNSVAFATGVASQTVWLAVASPFTFCLLWLFVTDPPYSARETILLGTIFIASAMAALLYLRSLYAQVKQQQASRRLADIGGLAYDWTWEMNTDFRLTRCSLQGDTLPEKLGQTRWHMAAPADLENEPDKWRRHQADLLQHRSFRDFTYWAKVEDKYSCRRIAGTPLFSNRGEFLGYRGIGSNITGLSGFSLLGTMHAISQGVALYDAQRRLVICNAYFRALLSRLPEHISPDTLWEDHAAPIQLPDGRWLQINCHRLDNEHRLVFSTDVTALKAQQTSCIEQDLVNNAKLLQATVDQLSQGVCIVDKNLNIVLGNNRFFELQGYPQDQKKRPATFEEMVRYNAERGEYGPGNIATQVAERVAQARNPSPYYFERARPNGMVIEVRSNPLPDGGFITLYDDITQRKRNSEQLTLAATVLDNANEGIAITDAHFRMQSINPAFLRLTGYEKDELLGKKPFFFSLEKHDRSFFRDLRRALSNTGNWQGELWGRRKNSEVFVAWLSLAAINNDDSQMIRYVSIAHDITVRKEDQERIWQRANFDLLTGLPNRYLFMDRLAQALAQAQRTEQQFALLFLDLDGFKAVNDTFGHAAGDELLRTIGRRLSRCIRASDTVARLAGDEFTALLLNLKTYDQAVYVAEKFLRIIAMPVVLDCGTVTVHVSIGIAIFPQHAHTTQELVGCADAAMYEAKRQGKNCYHLADIGEKVDADASSIEPTPLKVQ